MQKATITNVNFDVHPGRAAGIVVEHPCEGLRGVTKGGPIVTSLITRRFKNGNFLTLNTHYKVKRQVREVVDVTYNPDAHSDTEMLIAR